MVKEQNKLTIKYINMSWAVLTLKVDTVFTHMYCRLTFFTNA